MKITLDLEAGRRGQDHARRGRAAEGTRRHETGSLGINILIGFGVVAVSAGVVALVPTPLTGAVVGAVLFGAGMCSRAAREQWALLAQICLVIGALIPRPASSPSGKARCPRSCWSPSRSTVAAVVARSSLLMAPAVLALGACLGARTGYWHATYALAIYEPALTVVLFSALALVTYSPPTIRSRL